MNITYHADTKTISVVFHDKAESIQFLNCVQPNSEESEMQILALIAQLEKDDPQQMNLLH